jgi:ribulose-5-phosphate 4-epimerase/fuculose-1-phosphate aldolase
MSLLPQIDHSGRIVGGGKPDRQYYNAAAFVIHSAVHAARPEVNAVCHSHTPYGKAFATLGETEIYLTFTS